MIQGLYAAANGMSAMEARHAVIANNIANVSTPGFKRQDGAVKGFYQLFTAEMGRSPHAFHLVTGPGGGVVLDETYTDLRNGPLVSTGDPLHVALMGPGYIAVDTPQGERFTRDGRFTVDVEGELATTDGYKIQDAAGGGIPASGGRLEIGPEGDVFVNGLRVGQIRIVEFAQPHALRRVGRNLFAAPDGALGQAAPAERTTVTQHALEMANVQAPVEMANMLIGLRAYSANQRVITTVDDTLGRLIERVGMPL